MIELNDIFSDSDKRIALWCNDAEDTNDLATLAENIIENGVHLISVPSKHLTFMWTCLEKSGVNIVSRYVFDTSGKNIDNDMSECAENIVSDLKSGANGVQIFVQRSDFERFVDLVSTIRDDLFFEHDMCIVLNILDIKVSDWNMVFNKLRDIRANAIGLIFDEDMGNRSDFIGRIYGMLDNWNFDGNIHFMMGNNFDRIDQVVRLVESMKPELSDKLHFFLEY